MFFNCIFSLSHVCFSPHCKAVRLTWFFSLKATWLDLTCPNWRKRTWYASMMEWILMEHTAVTCCWLTSYCLSRVRSLASSLSSSKTVLLHTGHVRQSDFWNGKLPFSFYSICDPKIVQIWTGWLLNSWGEKYSSGCARRRLVTLIIIIIIISKTMFMVLSSWQSHCESSPESWYSFTVPRTVEGWVDLVGWLHTSYINWSSVYLAWLGAKHDQWCNKWAAQTSPCVTLYQRRIFKHLIRTC